MRRGKLSGRQRRLIKCWIISSPYWGPLALNKKEDSNWNNGLRRLWLHEQNCKRCRRNSKTFSSNWPIYSFKNKPSPNPCTRPHVRAIYNSTNLKLHNSKSYNRRSLYSLSRKTIISTRNSLPDSIWKYNRSIEITPLLLRKSYQVKRKWVS